VYLIQEFTKQNVHLQFVKGSPLAHCKVIYFNRSAAWQLNCISPSQTFQWFPLNISVCLCVPLRRLVTQLRQHFILHK